MRVLVAPWGNPNCWGKAKYVVKFEGRKETAVGRNSLVVLKSAVKPDYTVIVVADTLADILECPSGHFESYENVLSSVRGFVKGKARDRDFCGISNPEVLVLPSAGHFRHMRFIGAISDLRATFATEMCLTLSDAISEAAQGKKGVEIFVDLSCGPNYLSTLCYREALRIAQAIGAVWGSRFVAFNSDPYPTGEEEPQLFVNIVQESFPTGPASALYLRDCRNPRFLTLNPRFREFGRRMGEVSRAEREIWGGLEETLERLMAFSVAITEAAPLAAFSFAPTEAELEDLGKRLRAELELYRKSVEVHDGFEVIRWLRIDPSLADLALAYLLAAAAVFSHAISRRDTVTLDEVEEVSGRIPAWGGIPRRLIREEIRRIRRMGDIHKCKGFSERDFWAHMGFEENIIEHSSESGTVRYCSGSKDGIRRAIIRAARHSDEPTEGEGKISILVATWGSPREWGEVSYRLEGGDKTYRSRNPLRCLAEELEPDEIVIVALDTLYGSAVRQTSEEHYADAVDAVKRYIGKRLRDFCPERADAAKVIVSPGVGGFGNLHFEGDILDFFYFTVAKLSLIVDEVIANLGRIPKEMRFVLDITHGINFMPVLCYRAVEAIADALSILSDVSVKVYCSEPFIRGTSVEELGVHLIEDREVTPSFSFGSVDRSPLMEIVRCEPPGGDESIDRFQNIWGKANWKMADAFACGVAMGFPLVVSTFAPSPEELRKAIAFLLDTYEDNVLWDGGGGRFVRCLSLREGILSASKELLLARMVSVSGLAVEKEMSIEDLKRIADSLHRKDRKLLIFAKNELNAIERNVRDKVGSAWKLYRKLIGGGAVGTWINPRNFLEHAGLEKNCVEVAKVGETIKLRYAERLLDRVVQECAEMCRRG